jgi:hypothetical protein
MTLGLVVESRSGATALLTGSSADHSASHGLRKHVSTLSDRVLLNPEVAHSASVRTGSPMLSARGVLCHDHLIRKDLRR